MAVTIKKPRKTEADGEVVTAQSVEGKEGGEAPPEGVKTTAEYVPRYRRPKGAPVTKAVAAARKRERKKRALEKELNKGLPQTPKAIKQALELESSLKEHHHKSDDELMAGFEMSPENELKRCYKINKEQRDMRLVLMHRLLIRKVSPQDIQRQLGVSVELYYFLRRKLDSKMRLDVTKLDGPYLIGDSLALYDEVRSMALTMSSSANISDPRVKLAAMTVALKAESDKNDFLVQCGVYAPQVVEHIIRGMLTSGSLITISGDNPRSKNVEQMVGELIDILSIAPPTDPVQLSAMKDIQSEDDEDLNFPEEK